MALDRTGKSVCSLHQIIPDRHGIVSLYRTLFCIQHTNTTGRNFTFESSAFDTEKYYDMSETRDAIIECVLLSRISMSRGGPKISSIRYEISLQPDPCRQRLQFGRNESRRHCCCILPACSSGLRHGHRY